MMSSVEEMKKFVKKNSYLLISPDQKVELFGNLRSLGEAISIDSSTISKKLNRGENYFIPKGGEYVFYIKKLN